MSVTSATFSGVACFLAGAADPAAATARARTATSASMAPAIHFFVDTYPPWAQLVPYVLGRIISTFDGPCRGSSQRHKTSAAPSPPRTRGAALALVQARPASAGDQLWGTIDASCDSSTSTRRGFEPS